MPSPREHATTAVITLVFAAIAWLVWDNVGQLVRGTFLNEFRLLINLLAVFATLSVLQIAVDRLRGLFDKT